MNDLEMNEDILATRAFSSEEYITALERELGGHVIRTQNDRYVRIEGMKYILHIDLRRNNDAEHCRIFAYGAPGVDMKTITDKAMKATRQYFK